MHGLRLSRIKANELNIFARGGAVQVKAKLNSLQFNAAKSKLQTTIDKNMNLIDFIRKGNCLNDYPSTDYNEDSNVPVASADKINQWINANAHTLKPQSNLKTDKRYQSNGFVTVQNWMKDNQ